jgi:hypothetical protein
VLDYICDEDVGPIDTDRLQRLIEQNPRGTDERPAYFVLLIPGRFPDQDHTSGRRSFTSHGLGCPLIELATSTRLLGNS